MEEYTNVPVSASFSDRLLAMRAKMDKEDKERMIRLKPMLCDFIAYYREVLGHSAGGYLHIVLDDGNLDAGHIRCCQEHAKQYGDSFCFFLASLMTYFTKKELTALYKKDWNK